MKNYPNPLNARKTACLTFVLLMLIAVIPGLCGAAVPPEKTRVFVVQVKGEVNPGMTAFIKRAMRDIPNEPSTLLVLELDTFGGRVDSALKIVDIMINTGELKTLAWVKTKAISAGALIALSCRELAMKHNTTIGDCAPIAISNEGPQMLGEKFQSPLRAKFRTLAKRNGYNEALAEAMVTADFEIFMIEMDGKTLYMNSTAYDDLTDAEKARITSKKTVVKKGELLTMDDVEAHRFGFSKTSASTLSEVLTQRGYSNFEIERIEKTWSEGFVSFIISISPFLMMVGLAALYMEFKAPGFGVPGIIGIVCLSLALGGQYVAGLADYTELLLVILGILLLGFELFVIPGFGIAGITGSILVAMGLILALQDFVLPDPKLPWQMDLLVKNLTFVAAAYLFSFFGTLCVMRYVLPNLALAKKGPYLASTLKESHAESSEALKVKAGDEGVAFSFLRPSGKMKIADGILDVITEGEFIEKGTPLMVERLEGNHIIVSKKEL